MYREAATRPESTAGELVFTPQDREWRTKPGVAAMQLFSLPFIVGAGLAAIMTPTAGLVGVIGSVVFGVIWWRRTPTSGLVLRVKAGELSVWSRGSKAVMGHVRLDDLSDVILETKTIQPLLEGGSAIPAMRFIEGRVGAEVDTSRIALAFQDGTVIRLGDVYLAHLEALDWFGKIRVFLRKCGWVPEDERAEPLSG